MGLASLDNSMPNKIPRACAVTIWTWTDEDAEFYENKISFVDKEQIGVKCLTTHTFCSNSAFDHEALLANILPCDKTTIVKEHTTENHLLYDKYIRHIPDDHQKLFNIMKDHKTPNFWPQRAFPDGPPMKNKKFITLYITLMMIASIILFAIWKFVKSPTNKAIDDDDDVVGAKKEAEIEEYEEYEPLIKSGP